MLHPNPPARPILNIEKSRLKSLDHYEILDTPPENQFDTIAEMAAAIFETPYASINFVGEAFVFFKSVIGDLTLDKTKTHSFFDLAIQSNNTIVFEDLASLKDEELKLRSTLPKEILFYAAAPIINSNGYRLGSITVMDKVSRKPRPQQIEMLEMLSKLIMDKLKTRVGMRKILRINDDRLNLLVHDLKNPMTTISLQSELLGRMPNTDDKVILIANKIHKQTKHIVDSLNHILSSGVRVDGSFKLQKVKINLIDILHDVHQKLSTSLKDKNQSLTIAGSEVSEMYGDEQKLTEIFINLIDNAIKFSGNGDKIQIAVDVTEAKIFVKITDSGVGLSPEDLKLIFTKFAPLTSFPTNREDTNKLGLSTAKMLIDMHHGALSVTSDGKGKGATFCVALPVK